MDVSSRILALVAIAPKSDQGDKMNRLPVVKSKGRFSFVIDLLSWALPFSYDYYRGYGWTHRFRVLCFTFHYRTGDEPYYDYDSYTEYDNPYDYEENDLLF